MHGKDGVVSNALLKTGSAETSARLFEKLTFSRKIGLVAKVEELEYLSDKVIVD